MPFGLDCDVTKNEETHRGNLSDNSLIIHSTGPKLRKGRTYENHEEFPVGTEQRNWVETNGALARIPLRTAIVH